jgi:hypothetical protein
MTGVVCYERVVIVQMAISKYVLSVDSNVDIAMSKQALFSPQTQKKHP